MQLVAKYRNERIFADTELRKQTGVKLQMRYVIKNNVPFVVFIGAKEVKENIVSLKDMDSYTQTEMTFAESVVKINK